MSADNLDRERDIAQECVPVCKTKVSYIVPCYNGRRYLGECLNSIIKTAESQYEIIVVDDGSIEDIRGVIERYNTTVRYVRQSNQGPGAARNRGVREAVGQYLRFVDCDDYLLPTDGLAEQIDLLDREPNVHLVYGQALSIDSEGHPYNLRESPCSSHSYVQSGDEELKRLLLGNHFTTSSVVIRRSIVDVVGLFRTDLPSGQDWDYWLRIAQVSAIGYVATPVVAYRVHGNSITGRKTIAQLQMQAGILDRLYVNPQFANRHAALRESAYAALFWKMALVAYRDNNTKLVRYYGGKTLANVHRSRDWQHAFACLWLIIKSLAPVPLRLLFQRGNRRCRTWMMARQRQVRRPIRLPTASRQPIDKVPPDPTLGVQPPR